MACGIAKFRITLLLGLLCWICSVNNCHQQVICPSGCQCLGLSADCHGDNWTLARVVRDLPAVTESFRFTVHPSSLYEQSFIDLNTVQGLGKFKNLQSFKLRPNSESAPIIYLPGLRNDIFCNWVHLKEIHLNLRAHYGNNKSVEPFSCLRHLKVLDLSNSWRITDSALRNLLSAKLSRHITTLLLRNIQMVNSEETTEIHFASLFSNLNQSSIEVLDLSANAIRDVYPGLLLFPNLKKLDLSDNLLVYPFGVSPWAKVTLIEAVLHPSTEELLFDDPGLFIKRNKQDKSLLFPGFTQGLANCLVSDTMSQFENKELCSMLLNLTKKLQNSSQCPFGVYIPIGRHLELVSMSGVTKYSYPFINPMPRYPICFDPNNVISKIDISNNHFAKAIDNPTLSNVSITGLTRIKSLNIVNNDFMLDNFQLFDSMPSLEQLLLGGNKVRINRDSQNELFRPLSNLRDLDLSKNDLTVLPYAEFAHLSKLQRLDLSDNRLSDLSIQLPNSSLQLLNLSSNGMTIIQAPMTNQFDKYPLLELDLQDNDFICNCKALRFIHWVQMTPIYLTKKNDLDCYTEKGHMPIAKINLKVFSKKCHPLSTFEIASISAAVAFCSMLLVVSLIVVHRQRWRIRHCWYRRRLRQEHSALNDDFEYDAYVSYSDCSRDVRGWVCGALHEEVECRRGLKLFIHQRDLLGGGFFLERVDAAMRKCRKTILVLSPEFLQSRTCLYEAWSAHTSMVTENRDAVVLVKLQPLPLAGLTGTLASLMQIRECLNWTEDPIGQNLFWEQLEDVLLSVENPIID